MLPTAVLWPKFVEPIALVPLAALLRHVVPNVVVSLPLFELPSPVEMSIAVCLARLDRREVSEVPLTSGVKHSVVSSPTVLRSVGKHSALITCGKYLAR